MIKDIKVVFGKGPDSRSVQSDDGRPPMWKKSIFWDLPYWEVLEVHHAIDVMHLTKNLCVILLGFLGVYIEGYIGSAARSSTYETMGRPTSRKKGIKDVIT